MKKLSMVVLLGLALSAVVSGCGNSETSTPPPVSTNAPMTAPTNAP